MLLAVLEKRAGMQLGGCDAYVNLTGGMRLSEPSIDLAVVAAIISSYRNTVIDEHTIIFGEVGLTGEVRGVAQAEVRIKEAEKMGFTRCIVPKSNYDGIMANGRPGIEIVGVAGIVELVDVL